MSNTTKKTNNSAKKEEKTIAISAESQKQMDEQKAIEAAQKVLNDQIEKFNRKKQLIENREQFQFNKERLNEVLSEIGTDYDESLDHEEFRIKLSRGEYRDDKIISISNTMIVHDFVEFAIKRIDAKVAEIESEILNG